MKPAKEMTFSRQELKAILESHDVAAFREFVSKNEAAIPDVETILGFDEEQMSEFMHAVKCTQPYLGDQFQESRNVFRKQMFTQAYRTKPDALGAELKECIASKGELPLCAFCSYFREPPKGEEMACMHMGSTPLDVACIGWTPIAN